MGVFEGEHERLAAAQLQHTRQSGTALPKLHSSPAVGQTAGAPTWLVMTTATLNSSDTCGRWARDGEQGGLRGNADAARQQLRLACAHCR